VVTAAAIVSLVGGARGDATPALPDHHHRIAFHLGWGSAVGELGVTYAHDVGPHFQLEAGAGMGVTGYQLSVMPKLVFGGGTRRFVMGVGAAAGLTTRDDAHVGPDHEPKPPLVWWLNADLLGYEYHAAGGGLFVVAVGLTTNLNAFHYDFFGDEGGTSGPGTLYPQVRIGGGFSL
jgi:hypothetical protein